MSKFNKTGTAPVATQAGTTTGPATTFGGGIGWTRDAKSQLMLTAAVNMVGEDTFYESAKSRDDRFRRLIHQVAVEDYGWMHGFVQWLRAEANMRSASIVVACEAVKARLDAKLTPAGRTLIDAACQRPDEPGEILGYWTSTYGRNLPQAVKRGVADAVRRLYSERSLFKYDSDAKGYRFGDVLNLTHPKPAADKPWQGELFKYALDRRRNQDNPPPETLRIVCNRTSLMAVPVADRRKLMLETRDFPELLDRAGMTWEALAGWLQGPMDAKAWEAIIPSMGAMALVRNLRNFDEAGVSDKVAAELVCSRISDPEEIRKSRMFPYRMLSAQRTVPSQRWGHALDKALDAACANLPALDGKTLILVDTSGSMTSPVSDKSAIRYIDVGALFGVALATRGNEVDLVGFADGVFPHNIAKGGSVLREIGKFTAKIGSVGYGTQTVAAIRSSFVPGVHKRVVIITDGQAFGTSSYGVGRYGVAYGPSGDSVSSAIPADVPLFGIDTTGYSKSSINTSKPNRYEIGGFSDAMFKLMGLLASGRNVTEPWVM